MFYKNVSHSVKTFYGVTFKPGEIKEVDAYINSRYMIIADGETKTESKLPQNNTQEQQKPSSEKPKKESEKEKKKEEVESKKDSKPSEEPSPEKSNS